MGKRPVGEGEDLQDSVRQLKGYPYIFLIYKIGSVHGRLPTSGTHGAQPNRMSHATPRPTVRFPPDGDLLPTLDPRAALDDGDHFYEDQPIEFQSDPILGFQIDRTGVHHNLLGMYGHEDLGDITRRVKVDVPEYDGKLDPNLISSKIGWITLRTILIGMACMSDIERLRFAKIRNRKK